MHFAIVQTWGIGDLVMTTPVISEFRRHYPEAKLTLIVGGRAQAALIEGSPLIDQILEIPQDLPPPAMMTAFFDLRRQKIDVAFVGTRIISQIASYLRSLSGIPVIIGDARGDREYWHLYNVCNTIDTADHRVDRMLDTFALWSRQPRSLPRFSIGCSQDALHQARSVLAEKGLKPGRFVVFHPGSAAAPKQWPKRIPMDIALRAAAEIIDNRPDLSVAFIFGPDDADLMHQFHEIGPRQVSLVGQSLPTTVAIISQAAGFIGSDSGLGHIAAALDIPTITLFGPTIPSETAPYGASATTIKRLEKLECQPCWGTAFHGSCPYDVRCMHELPESEILTKVMGWSARETDTGQSENTL